MGFLVAVPGLKFLLGMWNLSYPTRVEPILLKLWIIIKSQFQVHKFLIFYVTRWEACTEHFCWILHHRGCLQEEQLCYCLLCQITGWVLLWNYGYSDLRIWQTIFWKSMMWVCHSKKQLMAFAASDKIGAFKWKIGILGNLYLPPSSWQIPYT